MLLFNVLVALKSLMLSDLNTSNVTIQQASIILTSQRQNNLNTSNVTIQRQLLGLTE